MRTFQLTVGPDGRVAIPETQPGQRVTVQVTPEYAVPARTEEERATLASDILRAAQELRKEAGIGDDEASSLMRADMLYGENGLPR